MKLICGSYMPQESDIGQWIPCAVWSNSLIACVTLRRFYIIKTLRHAFQEQQETNAGGAHPSLSLTADFARIALRRALRSLACRVSLRGSVQGTRSVLNLIICLLVNEISGRLQNMVAAVRRSDLGKLWKNWRVTSRARIFSLSVEWFVSRNVLYRKSLNCFISLRESGFTEEGNWNSWFATSLFKHDYLGLSATCRIIARRIARNLKKS